MARLIVHVGLGKTGTTALQRWLARVPGLAPRGILDAGLRLERLPGPFRFAGQGAMADPAQLQAGFEKIEAAAARPGVSAIVWSNEAIGMSDARRDIAAALSRFVARSRAIEALEIVLVLRRQDEWIESAYRQWGLRHKLRRGYGVTRPRQYLASVRRLLDYRGLHADWAAAGGRLRLLSYDDVIAGGGMARVFAREILGLPPEAQPGAAEAAEARVHVSPGPALSYFHAVHNAGFAGEVTPPVFGSVIAAHDLPELAPPDVAFFGRALRREILDDYRADNARLAQEALGRPRLFAPRPPAALSRYVDGPGHALTYLAMIAARQQALIEGRAPPEPRLCVASGRS